MKNKLFDLTKKLIDAETAQRQMLAEMYPIGALVEFTFMHGQVNPSSGTVTGHSANRYGGDVHVFHAEAKKNSRYRFRRVSPDKIVSVEGAAK